MGKTDKPPKDLRQVLSYDPETGLFHWLVSRGRVAAGAEAGTPDKDGYIQIRIDGTIYKAHRLAWYFMTDEWLKPEQGLDHEYPDPANNRWGNLRKSSQTENRRNRNYNTPSNNTSGQKGVAWRSNRNKWQASIVVNNRFIYLGSYVDFDEAVAVRKRAELRYGWR
jgi:hypothetical protein